MNGSDSAGATGWLGWAGPFLGAVLGHGLGAVVGVVLVSGPAAHLSPAMGLALVHVLADLAAALGALRGAANRPRRPTGVVGTVLAAGMLASATVLWPLGTAPWWLVLRASVVVVVATLMAARQPAAMPWRSTRV